jgi:hypothetical protein
MTASTDTLCPLKRVRTAIDEFVAEEKHAGGIIRKRAAALCFFKGYACLKAHRASKRRCSFCFTIRERADTDQF